MPETIATIDDFLGVVRKSGLVAADQLEEAVAAWPDRDGAVPEELVQALIDRELLTRWQADQLLKGRHKGFMLGKYRLLRLLGAGGMSSVYLAENTTLQGKVAIKVLPRKFTDKTSYLARFEREARTAWRLSHANIVRAFDLETAGPIHFIAMEYVDGIDLHAKVKRDGPLQVEEAIDLIRQAALGLQHAHEEGLVHRDVKPANLILNARGVVKILDLGLASAKDEDGSLTEEHNERVLGTADYLAPEQAKNSHDATPAADIYALGCTLHFLLTGRPPFDGGRKLAERIRAHAMQPPPNLLDERPDVPPEIVTLFLQMMEKNPAARPATAGDVADRLGKWLERVKAAGGTARTPLPRRPLPRRPAGGPPGSGPGGQGERLPGSRPPVPRRGPGSNPGHTPPPRSPARETLPLGRPRSAVTPGFAINIDTHGSDRSGVPAGLAGRKPAAASRGAAQGDSKGSAATGGGDGVAGRQPTSRSTAVLGLPLVAWAGVIAGLVLALGLGALVYTKWSSDTVQKTVDESAATDAPIAAPGAEADAGHAAATAASVPTPLPTPAETGAPPEPPTPSAVPPGSAPKAPLPADGPKPGGQTLDDLFGTGPTK